MTGQLWDFLQIDFNFQVNVLILIKTWTHVKIKNLKIEGLKTANKNVFL